jgi:DNA-binding NtrC family response regulator
VAATHRQLSAAARDGNFREDLLHRLLVGSIDLPALRERAEDIDLLSAEFLRRDNEALGCNILGLNHAARDELHAASWPGNVRELEHTLRRAVAMTREGILQPGDLGLAAGGSDAATPPGLVRAAWEERIRRGDAPGDALLAIRLELESLENEWRKSEAKK